MKEYESTVHMLTPVLGRGRWFDPNSDPLATPLAREIAYGVLREYFRLDAIVRQLVQKPLAERHADVRILLLAGLYSVDRIHRPEHASVNAVVEAAAGLGKPWAKGLVNGVLRNYLRRRDEIGAAIASAPSVRTGHAGWLARAIGNDWPEQAGSILTANNEHAPMTLRVNLGRIDRGSYLSALAAAGFAGREGELADTAIYLETPVPVDKLPGFHEGLVSVQDEASQLAAAIVAPQPKERVLDACAAPGGKTCHLLEMQPSLSLVALDVDADRCQQLSQNLSRLSLMCRIETANLTEWMTTDAFERILLDVPCSATGVIRRHPDIKLLRQKEDIAKLASAQLSLLQAAWRLLEGGGVLVYSTCSVLKAENDGVVGEFLDSTGDAALDEIDAGWGHATRYGRQLLPTSEGHDGFYYARLTRARSDEQRPK